MPSSPLCFLPSGFSQGGNIQTLIGSNTSGKKESAIGMVSRAILGQRNISSHGGHVVDWLLEENQPAVRYYTLIDILGRKEDDWEAREARSKIPRRGWAKDILNLQRPGGYWEPSEPSWRRHSRMD